MILHGDCLEVMPTLDAESIDAIVTDPPYGLEFMGMAWDQFDGRENGTPRPRNEWGDFGSREHARGQHDLHRVNRKKSRALQAFSEAWAREALRVAKPGAYLLAFGGTRTVHRMACAIEDAGWIIRDLLVWGYASGFPKSKASLKPAWEPIVMARKPGPLRELAIDACRIGTETTATLRSLGEDGTSFPRYGKPPGVYPNDVPGRWPANIVLTATEWYTLRDDIARPIRDTIAEYFEAQGVGVHDVPRLRQGVRDNASMGAGRTPEVLLPTMQLEGVAGGQADGRPAYAGVAPADEGREDGAVHRSGVSRLEGRTLARPERLPDGGDLDSAGSGAGAGRGDGDEGLGLHPGAPAGHGDDAGPPAGSNGDRPSPQRSEGRQSTVQPVPQGSAQPLARAPDGGPRVGAAPRTSRRAGGRERSVTVPLDLIPEPWRRYFRFSHDTGIFDGGWEGVVGGGETAPAGLGSTRGNGSAPTSWDKPGHLEPIGYGDSGTYSRFFIIPKADRSDREPVLGGLGERHAGIGIRAAQPGEYKDFVHLAPEGIGAWLREQREAAGLSAKALCAAIGAHGAVNHGGAVSNWEQELNRPTPDQWRALRGVLGFDDRYDEVMTTTRPVSRSLMDGALPARRANHHPTVKPTDLMRHLVRLVTPQGGTVLDPFLGSGTTALAAEMEGFAWVGIEREAEYVAIAEARLNGTQRGMAL